MVFCQGDDDDDYVLSHSSLCSHDSDDEEQKSRANLDPFSQSSYREEEIENMLTENMKESTACEVERSSSDTPSALDGLISGVLLLKGNASVSGISNDTDDSISALGCGKNERPSEIVSILNGWPFPSSIRQSQNGRWCFSQSIIIIYSFTSCHISCVPYHTMARTLWLG